MVESSLPMAQKVPPRDLAKQWLPLSLVLLGFLTWGTDAAAGAWPREKGASFLSFTLESPVGQNSGNIFASLFYEYGITPNLTFGIDAGRDLNTRTTSALIFLRYPVFSDGANKFAVELGLGETAQGGRNIATVRPGLSWGRGFTTAGIDGWMGVEATYAHRTDGSSLGKVDATLGANLADGQLAMLQVQYETPSNTRDLLAIAPSYVFGLAPDSFLQVGLRHEIRSGTTSAKIGVWLDF